MLHYQSTSFHDALYVRHLLGLKPAPEFEEWLLKMNIMDEHFRLKNISSEHRLLQQTIS
jgi:ethanolamine ammonia-lyase large subunit